MTQFRGLVGRPRAGALVAAAGLSLVLGLTGCAGAPVRSAGTVSDDAPQSGPASSGHPTSPSATSQTAKTPAAQTASPSIAPEPQALPRGGQKLFPRYRLVGYSGHPGSPALGRLGVGNLDKRVKEMEKRAKPFADGRHIMPVLELITVVVQGSPGADGQYRSRTPDTTIQTYLDAARRHKALLLLNVQPGRSSMTVEVKRLAKWLKQPDVGLALDPEWDVGPGQVPGRTYGHTSGAEINEIAGYLDKIVRKNKLPQKALVYHQVAYGVVSEQNAIKPHPGVAVIKSVDGIGSREAKTDTYNGLMRKLPTTIHPGFKLFFEEDRQSGPLMTPRQVLALKPRPEYVLFE